MSDKMVEEMARAIGEKLHELDADPPFHADALAQAAATIAERRMEEMREALELGRARMLSEWIDRPMLVGGQEYASGQITIADILDHAAFSYEQKQRVRAELHEWKQTGTGAMQCERCYAIAWSSGEMKTKCAGSTTARVQDEIARAALRPSGGV
jgi:hypothetical protein